MLLKETINDIDGDSIAKKKSSKKKKGIFSSLLDEIIKSKKLDDNEKPSFYDAPDSSFFGDEDFDDLDIVKPEGQKPKAFNFNWWEYVIIFTELILLIYAILVFLNQVPIF